MKYKLYEAKFGNRFFRIKEDLPDVGWYLYVFEANGYCSYDYLQDTFDMCKSCALEQFNVPLENWYYKGEMTSIQYKIYLAGGDFKKRSMMKFTVFGAKQGNLTFKIKQHLPEVGAILQAFENGVMKFEYLLGSAKAAKRYIKMYYDVPPDAWSTGEEVGPSW